MSSATYQITDIAADSRYEKANELYVQFNVKGQKDKVKTSVLAHDNETYAWTGEVLTLKVGEGHEIEVAAYTKRTLVPDHLVGEFTFSVTQISGAEKMSGTLQKSDANNGRVTFTISSQAAGGATSAPAGTSPANPVAGGQGGLAATGAGAGAAGAGLGGSAGHSGGVGGTDMPPLRTDHSSGTSNEAAMRANAIGNEASLKSDATANQAAGATVNKVDRAEQKLENFKADMAEGKHRPHSHTTNPVQEGSGVATDKGAYNRRLGIPEDAGTASDAPGTGTAHTNPADVTGGGSEGANIVATAPTTSTLYAGAGSHGASAPGNTVEGTAGGIRGMAISAANKAEDALEGAKNKLFGGASTATTPGAATDAAAGRNT